jgi:hypothetical protein
VKLISTEDISECVCNQINLYVIQVISAVWHPFSKHGFVRTWILVTVPELKKFLGLMFVTEVIEDPNLKLCWTEVPVFETPVF